MLSLVELDRVAEALSDTLVGGRIERWLEPEPGRIAFSIYRRDEDEKRKCVVELDARPDVAHLAVVERMPGVSKKKKNDGVWLTGLRLSSPADRGSDEVTHGDGGLQTPLFTDFDSLRGVSKTASPPVTSSLDEGGAA